MAQDEALAQVLGLVLQDLAQLNQKADSGQVSMKVLSMLVDNLITTLRPITKVDCSARLEETVNGDMISTNT